MAYLYVILLLACASPSLAQNCVSCSCYDVRTGSFSVNEFIKESPLYVIAIAPAKTYEKVDSICYDFSTIKELPDYALVQVKYTSEDMEETPLVYIEGDLVSGTFTGVGPTPEYVASSAGSLSYKDFIISEVCPSTYLVYRCELVGRPNGCPMMRSMATVFVLSKDRMVDPECIVSARKIAEYINDFSNIKFFELPNTASDPCPKPPPGSNSDDTHILKVAGLLHI